MRSNCFELEGRLTELNPMRVTPGGVKVASGVIEHQSRQDEAGAERDVAVTVPFVAVGDISLMIAAASLGARVAARGFVAASSRKSKKLVLHVNEIEFVEGNCDGFQT